MPKSATSFIASLVIKRLHSTSLILLGSDSPCYKDPQQNAFFNSNLAHGKSACID